MQTVVLDDVEVKVVFPGGVALVLNLAGKRVDIRAFFQERAVLVRSEAVARPAMTVDLVEARGPED
jgi:hypothetical protein